MRDTPWEAVLMAVCLAAVAGGAWRWQQTVRGRYHVALPADSWEQAQDQFPMPAPFSATGADPFGTGRPGESLQEVVKANPFSPQRRAVPPPSAQGAAAGGAGAAATNPAAQFVYKGRVSLGSLQRAIVEDGAAKKTYFLQVGQEVAGYKVLDISENEVVLSQSQTQEKIILRLTPKP